MIIGGSEPTVNRKMQNFRSLEKCHDFCEISRAFDRNNDGNHGGIFVAFAQKDAPRRRYSGADRTGGKIFYFL